MMLRLALAACSLAAATACTTPPAMLPPASASASAASAQPQDAGVRLRALLDASDEAFLERNPMYGLFRGDLRRAGQHGDNLTPAYVEAERRAAEEDLQRLRDIPRDALSPADRVACDTFRWSREEALERHSLPAAGFWPLLMLNQTSGWHLGFPEVSSGEGAAPYRTVADYDNGLSRITGFVAWLDMNTERLREGQRTGIVMPRVIVERVISQFDRFARQGPADSPYFRPITRLPAQFPAAERERLTRAYTAALEQQLQPAFRRMHRFLSETYLPSATATVGLSALPGGAAYYDFMIRSNTTTRLTAAEVHRLGLAEVDRITAGMTAVMREVGFDGTLAQFFVHLRTDPRFAPASAQAMTQAYTDIGRRVDARLPALFDRLPTLPLAIRPTPDYQAPTDPGARYSTGSLETGQPGVFYFNTYDLPSRRTWGMETLYLHEGLPGHHLQLSLAIEDTSLPKLLRFSGNTAFIEGWALYAESLGPELGLFTDPYQRFGHYNDEMLRAMRLVVDSGLHANGWTREQAIDYMLAHSAMGRTDVTSEVERYIAAPGQALAYKVGALTLQRLRAEAQRTLGPRFDLREFHREVLGTGSVPLAVLERKIRDWVATVQQRS